MSDTILIKRGWFTAGIAVVVVVFGGLLYALVDAGFLRSDVESDRDYYRNAAESTRRLLIAQQDTALRALVAPGMMKGPRSFILGTVEVEVDSTWSRVRAVSWE